MFWIPFSTLILSLVADALRESSPVWKGAEEQWREKGYTGHPAPVEAMPGRTALEQLVAEGIVVRFFGTEEDYAQLPEYHPLVFAEASIQEAMEAAGQGQDFEGALRSGLRAASMVDELAVDDFDQVAMVFSAASSIFSPTALASANRMVSRHPGNTLWRGYRAMIRALAKDMRGVEDDVVWLLQNNPMARPEDGLSWLMAVQALTDVGAINEAMEVVERQEYDNLYEHGLDIIVGAIESGPGAYRLFPRMTHRMASRIPVFEGPEMG